MHNQSNIRTLSRPLLVFGVAAMTIVAILMAARGVSAQVITTNFASAAPLTVTEADSGTITANVVVSYGTKAGVSMPLRVVVTPNASAANGEITGKTVNKTVSGAGSFTVAVTVRGDLVPEPSQTARVEVSSQIYTSVGNTTTLTVLDNDHPTVTINNRTTNENGGPAVHTITLSKAISVAQQFRVRTVNGTARSGADFVAIDQLFTVNANATTRNVSVTLVGDTVIDLSQSKTYTLQVTPQTPGDLASSGNDLSANGTINDDDQGNNTLANAIFQFGSDSVAPANNLSGSCRSTMEVSEPFNGSKNVQFRLTLDRTVSRPFEVNIFTEGTTAGPDATSQDFTSIDNVVLFPANTRSMTFIIQFHDDGQSEGDEWIGLRAIGGMIANTQMCLQNFLGANSDIKIPWNVF